MSEERSSSPDGVRILVVDDNEMSRRLIEFPLKREGHNVIHAESGPVALELLNEEPVDLIFLDLLMEGMDGRQVLETLQADDRLRSIPVVIVTGIEDADVAAECVAAGASEFLYKPAKAADLIEIVADLLEFKTKAGVESSDKIVSGSATDTIDAPVLDPGSIEQLCSDYGDTVTAGFIARYQELSIEYRAGVHEASTNGDLPELERAAHDMKGGARTLGLNRLAAACRSIERACNEDRTQDAQQAAGELTKHYDEARSALQDFVRTRGLEE